MNETFRVRDGYLVRAVVPARGKPYEHRCPQAAYEAVAHAADGFGRTPFTLDELADKAGVPSTQANTALAFLKERGCVVPALGRKSKGASAAVYEDGMVEYHALREKPA